MNKFFLLKKKYLKKAENGILWNYLFYLDFNCINVRNSTNVVMTKVYKYDSLHTNVKIKCTGSVTVNFCRDSGNLRYH